MSQHQLRDYQQDAVNQIRECFANGCRKVLLHLATGSGKTTIFAYILRELANKNNQGMLIVRGRLLVDQASERLSRDGVHHGVLMANDWRAKARAKVQVCSIDTLMARNQFPPAKLIVVDEAHLLTSESSVEFLSHYPDSFILAVTATPYCREPMNHLADVVVNPISMQELIDEGYLVAPRYFAPSIPDLTGVRTVAGDYNQGQLQERMAPLTGDIVQHWLKYGENRPTLCFAVNIDHSKVIVDNFKSQGITAEHLEAGHTRQERSAAIARLISGETKIISNVGIMCTGIDIPAVSCIIMARPTKSLNLYIQQIGRGTRISEGKKDFLVLDHAGNVLKNGFITDEHDVDLNGCKKTRVSGPKPKTCKKCYRVYTGSDCPDCGPQQKTKKEIEIEEGELLELIRQTEEMEISRFIKQCKNTSKQKGYAKGWTYYQVKEKYGEEIANKYLKNPSKTPRLPPWLQRRTYRVSK